MSIPTCEVYGVKPVVSLLDRVKLYRFPNGRGAIVTYDDVAGLTVIPTCFKRGFWQVDTKATIQTHLSGKEELQRILERIYRL